MSEPELTSASLRERALYHLRMFEQSRLEVEAWESEALAKGRVQQAERIQPSRGLLPDAVMAGFLLRDNRGYAVAVGTRNWHQQALDVYTKAARLMVE